MSVEVKKKKNLHNFDCIISTYFILDWCSGNNVNLKILVE